MKQHILIILMLCLCIQAKAEHVSKEAAQYTAQAYLLTKGKSMNTVQLPYKANHIGSLTTSEKAYYYVFNAGNNEGYVIVSGDDRTEPILGYVEQGNFDPNNIPENMRSWLQFYADQIKYIVDNDIKPESPALRKSNKIQTTKHSVGEILTTRWNQGHPYNITCPKYYKEDGTQDYPAAGCVATAMAQVVNFHRFPEKIKVAIPTHSCSYTLSDGTKKTVNLKAIPRNTPIDWENMRDTYTWEDGHVANAQDSAVANLMLYCGQGVKMGYGGSSGAVTAKSRDFFVKHYGYDDCAFWAGRDNYSIDQWFNLLYEEIAAGYPVLFSGHSSGGGHAFVLDGFDGENLFHVNWGWGGGSNGYFLVSILNPGDNSGIGASSSSDGYSMYQGALINLRTPSSEKQESFLKLNAESVTISNTSIVSKWANRTGATGSFNTCIAMLEEDGTLTPVTTLQTMTGMGNNTSQSRTYPLKNRLTEGNYKLTPASKTTTSKIWRPCYNMIDEYIEASVDAEGIPTLSLRKAVREIAIDTIVFPGNRVVGTQQEVKVTFKSPYDEYFKLLHLVASKNDSTFYTESKSMVAARGGESVEVSYFFTPEETGSYKLMFCTESDGRGKVGECTMEVITEAEAVKAQLSVYSYSITNTANGTVYGKCIIGKAAIRNQSKVDFRGKVRVQIWSQKKGQGVAWSGSSRTIDIEVAAGKIANIEYEFDNLSEGYIYRLPIYYVGQSGNLSGGGLWDHGWEINSGVLTWKNDGTIAGKAYSTTLSAGSNICGILADCKDIKRLTPSRTNPNVIYAFAESMALPTNADTTNFVHGSRAKNIKLVNNKPFYNPVHFEADTATFVYTFPETEDGKGWHSFTLPFEVDSMFLDNKPVALDDSLNHFWIYEYYAQRDNGEVLFAPATTLYGSTPYIIAADSTMAGRSITFRSYVVPFQKTGSDKMVVSSEDYKFHGTTISPYVKDCYLLNDEGTAFEYTTSRTQIDGLSTYFTTSLPEDLRQASIALPEVPKAPVLNANLILDENASTPFAAGTYNLVTLKRTFSNGWNTICLPFDVSNIEKLLGEGAKAYQMVGFVEGEFDFVQTPSLSASYPYIVFVPQPNDTEGAANELREINLENVTIDANNVESKSFITDATALHGTYASIEAGQWHKLAATNVVYELTADGSLVSATQGTKGFRAYFDVPEGEVVKGFRLYDTADGIKLNTTSHNGDEVIYNISGQKMAKDKMPRGIYIIGNKKVLNKR